MKKTKNTRGTRGNTQINEIRFHMCYIQVHKEDTKVQIQLKKIQEVTSSSQSYEEVGLDDPMMGTLLQKEGLISNSSFSKRKSMSV